MALMLPIMFRTKAKTPNHSPLLFNIMLSIYLISVGNWVDISYKQEGRGNDDSKVLSQSDREDEGSDTGRNGQIGR